MAKSTARAATPTLVLAPTPVVTPDAAVRVMTVCVPGDLSTEVLNSTRNLAKHFGVSGTSAPRYWASSAMYPWQRSQLFDLHKARTGPRYCAGGPIRLLDLAGMRQGAYLGASVRHGQWASVVTGTRPATPWSMYLQRHLSDPSKYPLDTATADFHRQPRVQAMRMHNAAVHGAAQFDTGELEMFQAGMAAYANYHALWALCTDAFLAEEGDRMQPDNAHFDAQITYLSKATRYLESLDPDVRLFAINLT